MKDEEMVSRLIGAEKFYTTELEMLRDIQKCFKNCMILSAIGFIFGALALIISVI